MTVSGAHSGNPTFAGNPKRRRGTSQDWFFLADASGSQKSAISEGDSDAMSTSQSPRLRFGLPDFSYFTRARNSETNTSAYPIATRLAQVVSTWLLLMPLAAASDDAERIAFFENKVRPLLIKHCYECHSANEEISGGLALDWRGGWASGGDSGPVIVPGSPEKSLLITAVRYEDVDYEMPPDGKLAESEDRHLRKLDRFRGT